MANIIIGDNTPGIYMIRNNVRNKLYIGSSIRVSDRLHSHRYFLNLGYHHSPILQKSWIKYGEDAFIFEQFENCSVEELDSREQYWIDRLDTMNPNGYNLVPVQKIGRKFKRSEETRKKIKESRARWLATPESRIQLSAKAKKQHAEGKFGRATWTRKPKWSPPKNPRPYWSYWPKKFREPWMAL